ncbi:MAG: hypothetical protein ABI893_10155 [Polaromonas sp.]|uniref:hypothetical protein n=1 Tax=Polaromonas sp. TaxID=1869339 RepID=UPI0032647B6F
MNFHPAPSSVSSVFRPSVTDLENARPAAPQWRSESRVLRHHRPRIAAYVAFFITVFASMAAAAALAIHDMPLMVVGL